MLFSCSVSHPVPPIVSTNESPRINATTAKSVAATIPPVVISNCPKIYSVKVWRNVSKDTLALEYPATDHVSPATITLWHWSNVTGTAIYTSTNDTRISIGEVAATYSFVGWTKPGKYFSPISLYTACWLSGSFIVIIMVF